IFDLIKPYDRYVQAVEFGSRGGCFVALSSMEELLGLRALHQLLCQVSAGRSSLIQAVFVAPRLGLEGALLTESPRQLGEDTTEQHLPMTYPQQRGQL